MAALTADLALFALICALWGQVWTQLLTGPGGLFVFLRIWFIRALSIDRNPNGWRLLLFKPLFGCGVCHGGQVAAWWLIFTPGITLPHFFATLALCLFLGQIVGALSTKYLN